VAADLFAGADSQPATRPLTVFRADLIGCDQTSWEDLFDGFTSLRAITFSSSLEMLLRLAERFDDLEIVFGSESMLSREQLALAQASQIVETYGFADALVDQKALVEALARLGRKDIRCLLVGADQGRRGYRRAIEARIAALGMEAVVHLVEHCNDMPAAYMLSDVVVSASTDPEAFGRVMVEAQAMGRPVIATDHGGARETVLEGPTGRLVPPGDAGALAAALAATLALDGRVREQLAPLAITHVRANFSKEAMCAKTLAVYGELYARQAGHVAA